MIVRFLIFSILISNVAFAQLTVSNNAPYNTPVNLVNQVLMSSTSGNAASNIVLSSGNLGQIGYFNGTLSNIGVDEGVLLSTGGLGKATPQNDGLEGGGVANNPDPDLQYILTNIANTVQSQNNTVVVEFDFVAGGDFIEFEYVFASNEYDSYTCSKFNDVFGFFLSGPGINGPYSDNAKNIALVPNPANPTTFTNTPVMINTVNSGFPTGNSTSVNCESIDPNWESYSTFFIGNSNGNTVSFNGFTVPLKAYSEVICGETYHIKLAITDVGDQNYNSGVFLKKGSFEVGSPLNIGISGQTNFVKCDDDITINSNITGGWGTVTTEWTYDGTPFSNQEEVTITDNGVYTITVTDNCGTISHTILVSDYVEMDLSLPDTIVLCDETTIIPNLIGGAPLFDYSWVGPGFLDNSPQVTFAPGYEGLISLSIEDNCNFTVTDEVYLFTPEELTASAPSNVYLCEGGVEITAEFSGGYGEVTYYWELNGVTFPNTLSLNLTTSDAGIASFHTIDECGVHLINETIVSSPGPFEPIAVDIERQSFEICDRDYFAPPMVVSGGAGGVSYEWFVDGESVSTLPNYIIDGKLFEEGFHTLSFILTDVCGNTYEDVFKITKLNCYVPNVFTPSTDLINDGFIFPLGTYQYNVEMRVFDRWGMEVYYSKQYERCNEDELDHCWIGQYQDTERKCLDGVYFYLITFKDGNVEKGTVTIFNDSK